MTDDSAPQDISTLSPELAAEKLVELSRAYDATQPEKPVHLLSNEEAGARLAVLTKAFHESNKPRNSPADAKALGTETPPADIETVSWPRVSTRSKLDTIDALRALDMPAEGIKGIVAGRSYSAEDMALAKSWKQTALSTPELRDLILSGDQEAVRHLVAASAIIAGGIAEPKP